MSELAQEQKSELTRLMNDCPIPKLKRVLEEGLPRFISGEITPVQHYSGVSTENFICYSLNAKCCLLGSAMIKKRIDYNFLSLDELDSLTSSFDGNKYQKNYDKEIYDYVAQIRKVIFGC